MKSQRTKEVSSDTHTPTHTTAPDHNKHEHDTAEVNSCREMECYKSVQETSHVYS